MKTWKELSEEEKREICEYLDLLKKFNENPGNLSMDQKRWVLQRADLPTWLVPLDVIEKHSLC